MKPWLLLGFAGLLAPAGAAAQGAPAGPRVQATAKADYDSFFGFYPSLNLTHPLDSLRQLSAYGTYYTQAGSASLELGASFTATYSRRGLTLTPSAGVLSGRFFGPGRSFLVGEGYTASLGVQQERRRLSAAAQLGYYGLLRQKTPDVYDIAYYHVDMGYKCSARLTVGVLYEQILAVRLPHNEGDTSEFALSRVGAFGRGRLPGGVQAEVAGGWWPSGFVRASLSRMLTRPGPRTQPRP